MQNYINGLLENPMFNLGVGLLNASGPRPVTSGFGNVLAQGVGYATDRQAAVMRNQAYRDQLAASKRQQEARGLLAQQFQGVPGGGLIGNLFDAGYGQEAIGLIAPKGQNLSPDIYSGMQMTGAQTPEEFFALMQNPEIRDAVTSATSPEAYAAMQQTRAEERRGLQETAVQRNAEFREVRTLAENVSTAIELNEKIAGTIYQTGAADYFVNLANQGKQAFEVFRAALKDGVIDDDQYDQLMADRQVLEATLNKLPLGQMTQFESGTGKAILDQFVQSKPQMGLLPEANDRLLKSILAETLASNNDYAVPGYDGPMPFDESLLSKYSGLTGREFRPGAFRGAPGSIEEIIGSAMSLDDIRSIRDQYGDDLTNEQIDMLAAKIRMLR